MRVYKSKTINFAALLAVLSVIQGTISQFPLSATNQMWLGLGVSISVALLRTITTTPLKDK